MKVSETAPGPKLYTAPFILMAVSNLFTVSNNGCFFLFPLYVTDLGGDKTDIGVLMGAMALAAVLSRPWIAQVVDRLGRKRGYTIGCLMLTTIPWAYRLIDGPLDEIYPVLIIVRIVHGIGIAFAFTSVFTYIADIIPEKRLNEGLSMFGTTGLAGMAIGPLIGEIVIKTYSYHAWMMTCCLLGLAGLLLQWPLKESFSQTDKRLSRSFLSVLFNRKLASISTLAFLFGVGLAAYGGFAAAFGKHLGLSLVSLFFISYSTGAVLTRVFGGRLGDRIGEARIVPYALILTGGGIFMLTFLDSNTILVVAGFTTGVGHGFLYPSLNVLAIRNEPINIRGKINAIYTGGIDAGIFVGSIVLGLIGDSAGYPAIFCTAGGAVMSGLAIYFLTGLGAVSKK